MLKEAFDNKRREFGEVKFSETSLDDPHVKDIIDKIVNKYGVKKEELIQRVQDKVKEFEDIAKKSPILYDTIKKNIIEQQIFDLIEEHKIADTAPRFSVPMFSKLIRLIKIEHDQFFPLRNFIDHKYLYKPIVILVPSNKPEYKKYNDVDTAAATPTGEFIFCVPFMQKLIDYAHLKGITPKGKKYKSNGGEIPDEYAYIEFLIIHEYMHYTYADFHYQKKLKANGKIINWVGDFRTNYLLVKSGFEQLPIGLFSDHVNYDRQRSYKEMYDIVKAEFDKLTKDQQDKVENMMDGMGDNHNQGDDGESDGNGSGAPGDAGDEGEEGDDKSSSGSGGGDEGDEDDGDGKPGKGKKGDKEGKDGKGGGDEGDEGDIFDEMDKNNEDIQNKLNKRKEVASEKEAPESKDEGKSGQGNSRNGGSQKGGKDGEGSKFDYSQVRPTFSWKKLLSKMVTDSTNNVEETFQKPHRRNITGVDLARQTGAAAMKPGEIPLENELKMGFVVDSSGSMTPVIDQIYANLDNLMKGKSAVRKSEFYLIKFSNSHHIYQCNFTQNKYKEIDKVFEKPKVEKTGSVRELFSKHLGAGTVFSHELASEVDKLAKKKFNILIMSDADILYGDNFDNVKKLVVENRSVFVILDSRSTFEAFCKNLKQVPKNVTYFE